MEKEGKDKILAFDSLFTTNHIQIFKILLSYMNPSAQKNLAIYIKLMELQYTLAFFQKYPHAAVNRLPREGSMQSARFFDEITPFCDISQRTKINQFKKTLQSMEQMQEMMGMVEMMKELFPQETGSTEDTAGMGPGNMDVTQLLNMLGGGNMPDLSGMSDIISLLNAFQSTNTTEQ